MMGSPRADSPGNLLRARPGRRMLGIVGAMVFANAIVVPSPAPAQTSPQIAVASANLNITPRRVIFDSSKRTEAVYVFNQGSAAITVDVALVDNVMLASGEIVPITEAAKRGGDVALQAQKIASARDLVIATPSRLTLEPGKGKTIRLRATPKPSADAVERRTHLTVTTVPSRQSGLTAEAAAAAAGRNELVFNVQSVFGLSIPLIVRTGTGTASANFGKMQLSHEAPSTGAAKRPVLVVPVQRAGNYSLYGNLEVRSGKGTKGELVGLIRGIGVYAELGERIARVPLTRPPRRGETLHVTFINDEGRGGGALVSGSFVTP